MRPTILAALVVFMTASAASQFTYQVYDTDGIPSHVYAARRDSAARQLSPNAILAVIANDVRNREHDVDHEYRQDSDLLYLTGYPDPGAVLLVVPRGIVVADSKHTSVLFVRERVRQREQWSGITMGPAEATRFLGIPTLPMTELRTVLEVLLPQADTLHVSSLPTPGITVPLIGLTLSATVELMKVMKDRHPTLAVRTSWPRLAAMREVKDTAELRLLRKAIAISIEGHRAAMRAAKPGVYEYQVEAAMEHGFKHGGAQDVGYPSIVGSRYNACILHYTTNRRQTRPGDLILADCGAEYHGYTADITRTFPVSGRFTREQRQLYDIVLEAQDSGIAAARPSAPFKAPHEAARRVIARRLVELGIIDSTARVGTYFMHGTSHYLGLDVHDPGTMGPLKPNTVITVEPGIYIPEDSPCDRKWWNIGIRIEDDILVTDGDPENLSRALPRAAADIEAMVGVAP
jgi:Xaa-Pro aminopeptidase